MNRLKTIPSPELKESSKWVDDDEAAQLMDMPY